jgi:hypothetical protein
MPLAAAFWYRSVLVQVLYGVAFSAMPLAIGAAILRYRLYDIDRVVSRTLAWAAVFHPIRRRIQAAVDWRFNRRRFDATRTVQVFSGWLREEVDLADVAAAWVGVVHREAPRRPLRVARGNS